MHISRPLGRCWADVNLLSLFLFFDNGVPRLTRAATSRYGSHSMHRSTDAFSRRNHYGHDRSQASAFIPTNE